MSSVSATQPMGAGAFRAIDPRQLGYFLHAVAVCLLLAAFFAEDSIAYLCVTIPVLLPAYLWISSGAYGIPILPFVSGLYYLYYAMPLLTGNTLVIYRASELVWAALSVGLFLTAACLAAWPFLGVAHNRNKRQSRSRAGRYAHAIKTRSFINLASNRELYRLICAGLGGSIIFYLAVLSGKMGYIGTLSSVVRATVLPLGSVACYLLGYARGAGALTGQRWAIALAGFIAATTLSLCSLFLVGGTMNIAAAMLGYVLAAKRIPWASAGFVFALLAVLNAGKGDARMAYWDLSDQSLRSTSLLNLPGMLLEWFAYGISDIGSSRPGRTPGLLERTSLLHMVLAVQEATPEIIPYLRGETYEYLPQMLVPRFINPEKIESQAVLNLLSIRYGRQREEDVERTTIGWGMVAEAYANYGNVAVIVVGAIFGAFCGMLMRMSAVASPLSLSMLIAIACTLTLSDIEADFSYLAVTLYQTAIGIVLFSMLPRFVKRRSPPPPMPYMANNPRRTQLERR
jgi:hypothetical protein